eukprot:CAMPEP_0169161524 /NCGR_PEP_ID=MMETSP1015-20121227/57093_1 /TAXON_ID=342587 /ORGANISM="Karlodinium micrum, Strain CCMP2283" /LENGTH=57 /DNA_ID=CAMNT_0009233391 /DNA_START=75 /DNA_END=248 /DNA_ORIENTATION=-
MTPLLIAYLIRCESINKPLIPSCAKRDALSPGRSLGKDVMEIVKAYAGADDQDTFVS